MNETPNGSRYFILATAFLRIGHYKSDRGAGVGIFGDSRFRDGPFLREGGGRVWPILSCNIYFYVRFLYFLSAQEAL